jgi:hypothetical protein
VLDFNGLLPAGITNATATSIVADDHLRFIFDGSNTTVQVDHDGGAFFEPTMNVVLTGVDLTDNSTLSNQQVLDNLLAASQLQV